MLAAGTNLWDAQQTVDSIIEDFPQDAVADLPQQTQTLQSYLHGQNVSVVDYDGYCKIDTHEVQQGLKLGKPREKVTNVQKMLKLALE